MVKKTILLTKTIPGKNILWFKDGEKERMGTVLHQEREKLGELTEGKTYSVRIHDPVEAANPRAGVPVLSFVWDESV